MPLFQSAESQHTHHHSLLAGVSAGAMGVLAAFGLVLLAWHRVAGAVGSAVTVIMWTVTAAVLAAVVYGAGFLILRLALHVRRPETLTRQVIQAVPVATESPAPQATSSQPVAELPAGGTHYHFHTGEAVEAALEAMQNRPERPLMPPA